MAGNRLTAGAYIVGIDAWVSTLRNLDPEWAQEIKVAHKDVADRAAQWAQWTAAGSGSRMQALASAAIKGRGSDKEARIFISRAKSTAFAGAAFWGAKRKTGWYGAAKYRASTGRQFLPWVGNTWDVAVAGQGPYSINDALAEHLNDILDFYEKAVERVAVKAFPNN